MYSRPTPFQTQEDLERLQDEFNKQKADNKIKIAAKVVSDQPNRGEQSDKTNEDSINEIEEQIANTFEAIPSNSNIGKIVEKIPEPHKNQQISFNSNRGFPKPQKRDLNVKSSSGGGSIFARSFKKIKVEQNVEKMEIELEPSENTTLSDKDKISIHQENLQKIQSMSTEEIMEERQRLIESMDPALINFLKSRKKNIPSQNPTIQQQNAVAEDIKIEQIASTNNLLTVPESENWLNFNVIETNKLAWMKDLDNVKLDKDKLFEARFDFEGWLQPFSSDITEKNRVLYHHGEEPARPGYTLQELFQLSRSNVIQQKIVALNTIANLLALNSTAVYEGILDLPLEQIFFVLRYCLDDNTPTVLTASVKAMRNLFYNKIDETCLDCLLGFSVYIQPILAIDNEMEDDNTVNDQQLAEKNLVKCLIRTGILTRIKYIINTIRPNTETIIYCMDILTRLVRDSQFILLKVHQCEDLIKSVIKHFLPNCINPPNAESPYGVPLLQAIKFLRVLAMRNRNFAEDLVKKYKFMDSLLIYLSSEHYSLNSNGLKLQTEAFHLWIVLIHYNLTIESFEGFVPVLMNLLNYHFTNTDLDIKTTFVRQGLVAALLNLVKTVQGLSVIFREILEKCSQKWVNQFMNITEFHCGKLQIISAIVSGSPNDYLDSLLLKMIESKGFETVAKKLKNGSMLLNNYETFKSSPNLKTLECAAWNTADHVVPIMQTNSPLPFLNTLSKYVELTTNKKLKLALINHELIQQYFKSLAEAKQYYLTSNWFTRVETRFLINILKISVTIKDSLVDTSQFYEVAVKSLSVFSADHKPDISYILANIIFSSKYYPSEVLLKNLTIEQHSEQLETSLNNLDDILKVYTQVLGLEKDVPKFVDTVSLDHSIGNVIPIDWIYTPIIVLYANQQQNKAVLNETQQVFTVRNCLRWILIYETYFPNLAASINPTDRFSRLACTFLASDSLFLVPEIHNLLELTLKNVLKNFEAQINFNRDIQGLSNFQDFYTQLLEQYQGVSYGDVLFGNVILVPLAQRHSSKWRKTLWSEYSGIVQIFNVTVEQSFCCLESFLEPAEEDLSILKCYRRALMSNSLRKHSILYRIAEHHLENYISRKRDKN